MTYDNNESRVGRPQAGITLIELMVTLIVVSILAMATVPSFMQSLRKGKRADAHTAITRAATNLERFFSTNGTYTTDPSLLGLSMDGGTAISDQGHYVVTIGAGDAGIGSSYVVNARARAGDAQADDEGCTEFSLNSLGMRTPDPAASTCW